MTMAELATDYAVALRAAFDGPVDVLGVSTGGSIAQQLAVDHPDVVRRLVLVRTPCRLGPPRRGSSTGSPRAPGPAPRGRRLAVHGLRPRPAAARAAPRRGVARLARAPGSSRAATSPIWRRRSRPRTPSTSRHAAAEIRCPTLVVAGAEDRLYSHALFEETNRLIPASRLTLVPGRGHGTVLFDAAYRREAPDFVAS